MTERYGAYRILPPELPPAPELADLYASAIMYRAEAHVGIRERGSNRGPLIDRALAFVGITEPAPWCTAIAVSIQHQAARDIGAMSTCPLVASGAKLWRWAMAHPEQCEIIPDPRRMQPGDIGIKGRTVLHAARIRQGRLAQGHTWTAASVSHDGWHSTYEGNTSPAGSREGDGFYRRKRCSADPTFVGWIRFKAIPAPVEVA